MGVTAPSPTSSLPSQRGVRRVRHGFTLVEVMIAAALLGFSLIVMFAFHSEAVRSNMNARRLTDCTYLAQGQMERLLAMQWERNASLWEVTDGGGDAAALSMWENLEWPASPTDVNSSNSTTATFLQPALYTVTWDATSMDDDDTWVRLRVRCTYEDPAFATRHGTTVSSFRYRDS